MSVPTLVFATNNSHKLKEARKLLPFLTILSLQDIDCPDELPETGYTLKSNSAQKARYIHDKFGMNCFSDDTGLEVEALDGRPGVFSARFAGPSGNASANIEKLLVEMKEVENRKALFRTVVTLLIDNNEHFFEGHIDGTIAKTPSGTGGFGYDPVFIPAGSDRTFSEMTQEEKNNISHRAVAMKKLFEFLSQIT